MDLQGQSEIRHRAQNTRRVLARTPSSRCRVTCPASDRLGSSRSVRNPAPDVGFRTGCEDTHILSWKGKEEIIVIVQSSQLFGKGAAAYFWHQKQLRPALQSVAAVFSVTPAPPSAASASSPTPSPACTLNFIQSRCMHGCQAVLRWLPMVVSDQ